ncbi:MAG: hypothetical protein KC466_00495 [Myxococcales bacterium]|nr:hypothetical protein [Myxococcales bacterium]
MRPHVHRARGFVRKPARGSAAWTLGLLAALTLGAGDFQCDPEAPIPVLFVHGVGGENTNSFQFMRAWLAEHGWEGVELREVNLSNSDHCIAVSAAEVRDAALALMADTGSPKIDIVGHSMGALASRYFVKFLGGDRVVRNFVSITSANHGTVWGNPFSPVCVVRDQAIGSLFLTLLNADDETPGAGVRYAAIRGVTDIFVQPSDSGALDGAWNVTVGLDHVEVLLYPSSFELVQQALSGGGANLN